MAKQKLAGNGTGSNSFLKEGESSESAMINPPDAISKISRVVSRLNFLISSVFSGTEWNFYVVEWEKHLAEQRNVLNNSDPHRLSLFNFIGKVLLSALAELEECYVMIYPEELGSLCISPDSELAKKVRGLRPVPWSGPDVSCMGELVSSLAGICSVLHNINGGSAAGLEVVVEDIRNGLNEYIEEINKNTSAAAA